MSMGYGWRNSHRRESKMKQKTPPYNGSLRKNRKIYEPALAEGWVRKSFAKSVCLNFMLVIDSGLLLDDCL
ncbi:hypothetical protein TH61_02390 [Rufibacter sp. DG15C]|nr:hypothetical protein TH61_02390 [Rufibacter sp. DG15C]